MTPEQSKVFDAYDRMFATDGWKLFIEWTRENLQALYPEVLSAQATNETLWFCKGKNAIYTSILGLEDMMEQARKMAMEEDESE